MSRSRPRLPAFAALALAASLSGGCVLPDQLSALQKDLADVREELQSLRREQSQSTDRLSVVEGKLVEGGEVKRAEIADVKADVERAQRDIAALDERSGDLQRRVERLSQDLTRVRETARRSSDATPTVSPDAALPGSAPVGSASSSAAPSPDALYNQAYADFSKGNYSLAISGFEEYATRFPESAQADNALYWIGESSFSEGRFEKAVDAFDRLLERYPDSDRAAAANLKKGLAYLEENDVRLAIVQLQYVARTYPQSDEAKIARDKLAGLGAPIR